MTPKLYFDTRNASLYLLLMPHDEINGNIIYKCIRISAKNIWKYEIVSQYWFSAIGTSHKASRFEERDINEEFGSLPNFQYRIIKSMFKNPKAWQ